MTHNSEYTQPSKNSVLLKSLFLKYCHIALQKTIVSWSLWVTQMQVRADFACICCFQTSCGFVGLKIRWIQLHATKDAHNTQQSILDVIHF